MNNTLKKELSDLLKNNEEYRKPNGVTITANALELTMGVSHACIEGEKPVLELEDYFPEKLISRFRLKSMTDVDALEPRVLWAQYKMGRARVNVVAGPTLRTYPSAMVRL